MASNSKMDTDDGVINGHAAKKNKTSHQSNVIVNVPTRNTYTVLANDVNDDNVNEIKLNGTTKIRKERIPPISVVGKTRVEVLNLCKEIKVKDFCAKNTTKGVNLYFNDINTYKQVRAMLADKSVPSFSHDLDSEKYFKVVLKDLFEMDVKELRAELKHNGIEPEDIKMMVVKKRKFNDQANYLLYFKKGTVTLTELKKCRQLCYVRVYFEHYSPKKDGPVRCRRCQMWGHGSRHCTLQIACMYCAENHFTQDCQYIKDGIATKEYIPKCINCKGAHSANYEECPSLQQYKAIQESIKAKNSAKNRKQVAAPVFIEKPKTVFHSQSNTFASVLNNGNLYTDSTVNMREDLMTPQQMINLTKEVIAAYRNCKTREQQFNVITELAIKYVYGNGCP